MTVSPDADPLSPPAVTAEADSVACGVDVVSIERIESALAEFGGSFARRVFAPAERRYCERQADPPQHYAARWAVKEAFVKALALDRPPVPFQSVAVDRRADRPRLRLREAAETALDRTTGRGEADGATPVETAVSLSHDRHADRAAGQVVLLWDP